MRLCPENTVSGTPSLQICSPYIELTRRGSFFGLFQQALGHKLVQDWRKSVALGQLRRGFVHNLLEQIEDPHGASTGSIPCR